MNNIRFYIHSTHCKTKDNDSSKDAVVVKEKILVKNDDGTEKWVDHLNIIRDPVRPFWITKPQFRDHHYKKEFEHISRLDQYICHDSELQYKLAQALGLPAWQKYKSIRELCTSPYVYGADISTETLIRQKYSDKLPKGYVPKLTKGAFDIENEVRRDVSMYLPLFMSIQFIQLRLKSIAEYMTKQMISLHRQLQKTVSKLFMKSLDLN